MKARIREVGIAAVLAASSAALAQVDSMSPLFPQVVATGGTGATGGVIYAVAYDPVSDTAYISGNSAALPTMRIRRITNVSTSPVGTSVLDDSQLNTWLRRGENRLGGGLPQGLTFNPAPVGSIPTAGNVWFSDIADIGPNDGSAPSTNSNNDPAACARIYRYNLADVPSNLPTLYDNVSQVLTPMVSKADIQTAAGVAPSMLGNNSGRKPAFSPDGQWLYLQDASNNGTWSGIYRVNPTSPSSVVKLATTTTINAFSEIGVVKNGSLDRIYYRSSNNNNGLTYIDHDPVANTTTPEVFALSSTDLQSFMEITGTPLVGAATSDAAGNLFVSVTVGSGTTAIGRVLRLDSEGRLMKVTTREERAQVFGLSVGSVSTGMRSMSTYSFAHSTAGSITRIVNSELTNGVSTIKVFKPYDFDRDGDEDSSDLNSFKGKLTLRGLPSPITDARFDLNGNGAIDWKDVKIVQSFAGFLDGDANMSGIADINDFAALAANFNQAGMLWTQGDFTGDEIVNITDFALLAANFNVPTLQSRGAVPEPSAAFLTVPLMSCLLRRRR